MYKPTDSTVEFDSDEEIPNPPDGNVPEYIISRYASQKQKQK